MPSAEYRQAQEPTADLAAWYLAVLLAGLYALSMVNRTILLNLVDFIKKDLRASDFEIGLIMGPAFGVPYACFGIIFGWAADRFNRRKIIFFGVLLWSVATTLSGFTTSLMGLAAARVCVAIGEAALLPTAISILSDRFPRKRLTSAIAVYNMGTKLGQSLGFLCAGLAIAWATTVSGSSLTFLGHMKVWQLVMMNVGLPGIILSLLAFTVKEPPRRESIVVANGDRYGPSFLSFFKAHYKVIVPFFLGFCAMGIVFYALTAWVPTFLERRYGWTAVQYGPWLAMMSLLGALTMLPKGALVDWLYSRGMQDAALRFYTWLLIVLFPTSLVFFLPHPMLFVVGYGLLNVAALSYLIYASTTIQILIPNQFRGRMIGLFQFIVPMIGQGLGPTLTAGLTEFVFKDPHKIGLALTIVTASSMSVALLLLRYALATSRELSREGLTDEGA